MDVEGPAYPFERLALSPTDRGDWAATCGWPCKDRLDPYGAWVKRLKSPVSFVAWPQMTSSFVTGVEPIR